MSRKFTRKEDASLLRWHAKGWPVAEMAYNLRRSVADCEAHLAYLTRRTEKRPWSNWQRRLLIEKVKVWPVEKLASYLGLSADDVTAKIKELKL